MTFLPVVAREMNIAARRKGTYWWRVGAAFVGLATLAWLFLVSAAGLTTAAQGKLLFTVLSGITFLFALMIGVVFTSDSLSEEKREGTLGLLFLTDLKGHDVAVGKLTASSVIAAFALLGIVPMISLTLLLGGVTLAQVGLVALLVLNTLLVSLGGGILVSALSHNERRAMFATLLLIGLIAVGPYAISAYYHGVDNPLVVDNEFLYLSPIYSFWLTVQTARPLASWNHTFLVSIGLQHGLAWLLLLLASAILPRVAHDTPGGKRMASWQQWVARWNYGAGKDRVRHRARLLDQNAFSWLAGREKVKSKYVWAVLVFFFALWYWIYRQFPNMAFDLPIVGSVLFLLHFIIKIWVASEVSRRMIEDRRGGALELLLSTPLSVKQVANGQTHALWRLFGWPVLVLLLGEIILARFGVRTWYSAAHNRELLLTFGLGIGSFLVDLWAIKWVATWRSLFGRSIGKVMVATLLRILLVPWLLFLSIALFLAVIDWFFTNLIFPESRLYWAWGFSTLASALFFALPARANFYRHFREIASQRFDAKQQKPPGWSLFVEDLARRFRRVKVDQRPRSFLRRHWIVSSATVVALLVLGGCFIRQTYWARQVNKKLLALELQGIPTTESQLARLYPKPPRELNAGDLLRNPAIIAGNIGNLDSSDPAGPLHPVQLKNCKTVRAANKASLSQLKEISKYPFAWFEPNGPNSVWNNNPWAFGTWFYLLDSQVALSLEEGNYSDALQYAESYIHILRLLNDQPFIEPLQVQGEHLRRFGGTLKRLLYRGRLSSVQLARLHALLGQVQFSDDRILNAFRGEIVRGISFFRADVSALQTLNQFGPGGRPENVMFALIYGFAARTGSRDKLLYHYLSLPDRLAEATKLPYPDRARAFQQFYVGFDARGMGGLTFNHVLGRSSWALQFEATIRAQLNILRTAVAVEHHYLAHSSVPNRLEDLDLVNDRIDPYSGRDLIYLPNPTGPETTGYTIYSFGPDLEDDQGRGNFNGFGNQDIVFTRNFPAPEVNAQ